MRLDPFPADAAAGGAAGAAALPAAVAVYEPAVPQAFAAPLPPPAAAAPPPPPQAVVERPTCVICLDASPCVLLLPCRHLVICSAPACAAMMGAPPLCPLCRLRVADTLEVYTV
jgi:hypothetical protein